MGAFLTVVWIGSLLLFYLGIVNIYPAMHSVWQTWELSRYVPDVVVSAGSEIFKFISQFRYEPIVSMIVFAAMTVIVLTWGLRCLLRGLLTTNPFRNAIDLALAKKLLEEFQKMARAPSMEEAKRKRIFDRIEEITEAIRRKKNYRKVVTFQMLRDAECLPLAMAATNVRSMAATNVRTGAVELFSNDATPKVIVADAIAASAAVPLLFQPVEIETDGKGGLYWDGGFTSNLPAWPFDAQREINPDLYTLTIEITGRVPFRPLAEWRIFRPFSDFLALVTASVFGARELETRRTRRAAIELNTAVRLLDFNMGPQRAHNQIEWSRLGLRASLNIRASVRKLYADKCFRIGKAVREYLMRPPPTSVISPRIRVSLLQPTRYGARALKTLWRFCSRGSFRSDTDDRLLFRKETSVPGLAWARFDAVLKNVERRPDRVIWVDPHHDNRDVGPRHRYSHRLLWDEMEWMLAVPVARYPGAGRGSTDWVVAIDSNIPLDYFEFADGQGKAYHDIVKAVQEIARELWQIEDNANTAAAKLDKEMGLAA
jgi:predicted acylesterase/phospholipase RssA